MWQVVKMLVAVVVVFAKYHHQCWYVAGCEDVGGRGGGVRHAVAAVPRLAGLQLTARHGWSAHLQGPLVYPLRKDVHLHKLVRINDSY